MKVRRMLVKNIPEDIYKKLYRMNLRAEGTMQEYLVESRRYFKCNRCNRENEDYVYVLKKDDTILSWAIWYSGTVNFWTHGRHRKKGYARKVAKELVRHQGKKLKINNQNYVAAVILSAAKKEVNAYKRKAREKAKKVKTT